MNLERAHLLTLDADVGSHAERQQVIHRLAGIVESVLALHPIEPYEHYDWYFDRFEATLGCPNCESVGPCATRQACGSSSTGEADGL